MISNVEEGPFVFPNVTMWGKDGSRVGVTMRLAESGDGSFLVKSSDDDSYQAYITPGTADLILQGKDVTVHC